MFVLDYENDGTDCSTGHKNDLATSPAVHAWVTDKFNIVVWSLQALCACRCTITNVEAPVRFRTSADEFSIR
jgi:hypothetical protein